MRVLNFGLLIGTQIRPLNHTTPCLSLRNSVVCRALIFSWISTMSESASRYCSISSIMNGAATIAFNCWLSSPSGTTSTSIICNSYRNNTFSTTIESLVRLYLRNSIQIYDSIDQSQKTTNVWYIRGCFPRGWGWEGSIMNWEFKYSPHGLMGK